ncbi:putative exostosin [Rosa chinensis]|uniref:Putative exostosin n=1 Tax=Rosa chinensis TaxID=74649 RepID=A0A2P6SBG7_ROSCH|nr:putative exostosin [Rosa chinensis]
MLQGLTSKTRFGGKIIDQCLASSVCKLIDCSSGGIKCDNPASVMRVFQSSILAGCIPVFFHPGTAYLQYLWHLPKNHTKYSVFIPVRYVEDLKEGLIERTLVGISKEEELEMREEVIRLIPKLVYADPMSRLETEDAFDLSVKGILETI